jgi:hypothetical protein
MTKTIIGSIVGGIILFFWQFLSHTILNLHKGAEQYTPKQDSIMAYLKAQDLAPGHYLLPMLPEGASMEDYASFAEACEGKPWARLSYYAERSGDMATPMIRGLLTNILMVALVIWLLGKMAKPSLVDILLGSLVIGLSGFMNFPYTSHIWYPAGNIRADLIDAVVMWLGLGLWLGWWLRRGQAS